MIKKLVRYALYVSIIGLLGFFFVAGKIADRMYNQVDDVDFTVSARAQSLHRQLLVADLHADNLLWDRNPVKELSHGHVDIPRLIQGNYALQVFDAVIQVPEDVNYKSNSGNTDVTRTLAMANRWPPGAWFGLYDRAIHQSEILHQAANESSSLEIIRSQRDLDLFMRLRRSNSYMVAGVLSIEGMHAIEGQLEKMDGLYDAGYRIMGLVHFFDNEIGGSSAGVAQGGLTELGKRLVRRMESKDIIIDLAHGSPALITDVLSIATRPVVVSHTGIKGVHDSPRNLTDDQLIRIKANGGLIGIGFWKEAVGDLHPLSIARSVRYVSDLIGIEYVALGSDFDGAVTTSFDASNVALVTEALIQEGFSDQEIKQIMGGNLISFLQEYLPEE